MLLLQVKKTFSNEKVGWGQRWCKKEKENETKILYLARVNVTEPKELLNIQVKKNIL